MRRACSAALNVAGALCGAVDAYLLTLLAAARLATRRCAPGPGGSASRFIIVIPAHDEEHVLGATLADLARCDYPAEQVRVVVIADNCTDATAAVAGRTGAEVLVRADPGQLGKGHAVRWGLERLNAESGIRDPVVFLDADCSPSVNLLCAFDARLQSGTKAAQAAYVVANPAASWIAALRWGAFALVCRVRPLAMDAMGLSCGIFGTGFVIAPDLLERVPWGALTLTEDEEYHLQLLAAGERVTYVPEAFVLSPMPTSLSASREQNLRWETGRWRIVRTWTWRLARDGLRARDPVRVHAAVAGLVPPQAVLLGAQCLVLGAATAIRARRARSIALVNLAAQAAYVFGGLRLAHAPRSVYRAMVLAPVLALWKMSLHVRILSGRGPTLWRGTRTSQPPPAAER